jgi:hypothetical protein
MNSRKETQDRIFFEGLFDVVGHIIKRGWLRAERRQLLLLWLGTHVEENLWIICERGAECYSDTQVQFTFSIQYRQITQSNMKTDVDFWVRPT